MGRTAGYRELKRHGFRNIYEVKLKWKGPGLWYEAEVPSSRGFGPKEWTPRTTGETVLFLRQAKNRWHAFYQAEATGSGQTAAHALVGGLGDAIDTDAQMKRYCDLVLSAPERLTHEYDGLFAAQRQCWHERQES